MKIVDAQIHIWSQTVTPPSGLHRKVESFTAEAGAEGNGRGRRRCRADPSALQLGSDLQRQLALDAAKKYPDRFAVMGQFPLSDPESRNRIKGWRKQPGMMGLRWALLHPDEQKWLHDGLLDWVWPAAEKEGIPVATMGGLFLDKFREIAEAHPNLKLIVDHCGLNRHGQDEEAFIHLDKLVALAKLPNVAVKATGAPHYSTKGYPFSNIQDGLHRIFDAFGPKRFFWGTDITRMPCTYRQCVTFFTEELPWLKGRRPRGRDGPRPLRSGSTGS